jgi:pyruvate dehydrogenase E2 component (dihydrolipoamide acetyltransferase)
MAKQFRFPDVGEGITEGEVVRWLVKEGEEIKADQPVAEIETDKAIVEMPSPYGGTVLKLHFKEKDIVKVGDVLITVGEKGEVPAEAATAAKPAAPLAIPAPPAPAAGPTPAPTSRPMIPTLSGEIFATPRIRKLAQDLGVDLTDVIGTGPLGRITEEDVQAAKLKPAPAKPAPAPPAFAEPGLPVPPAPAAMPARAAAEPPQPRPAIKIKAKFDFYGEVERLPLRGVRRATAKHMALSISRAAHVTHGDEADATALEKLRLSLKPAAEAKNIKLTYLPFLVKAVIAALRAHPLLNSTLDDDEEEIIIKKYYNIGIAVDVPDGLIVPVVKGAEQKTLWEIAQDILAVAEAARSRKLDLADLKGGTFSITNVGMIGGEWATPIINYPEVAILATLKIADRVRVVNGGIVIKKTLPLSLSFDHRVIDGAEAARFMNDLKKFVEDEASLAAAVKAVG